MTRITGFYRVSYYNFVFIRNEREWQLWLCCRFSPRSNVSSIRFCFLGVSRRFSFLWSKKVNGPRFFAGGPGPKGVDVDTLCRFALGSSRFLFISFCFLSFFLLLLLLPLLLLLLLLLPFFFSSVSPLSVVVCCVILLWRRRINHENRFSKRRKKKARGEDNWDVRFLTFGPRWNSRLVSFSVLAQKPCRKTSFGGISVENDPTNQPLGFVDFFNSTKGRFPRINQSTVEWNYLKFSLPTNQEPFPSKVTKEQHIISCSTIANQSGVITTKWNEMWNCQPIRGRFSVKWPRNSRCIKLSKFKSRTNQGLLLDHRQPIRGHHHRVKCQVANQSGAVSSTSGQETAAA